MDYDHNMQSALLIPEDFKDKKVVIIGCGATGSELALLLAQMGIGNNAKGCGELILYDFDTVEEKNLGNQAFYPKHVGMAKVEALKEMIEERFGFTVTAINMELTQGILDATYVFLLTDTMHSRKNIFEKCLKYSFNIDMIIETRTHIKGGNVYAFNPSNSDHVKRWVNTLFDDDEVVEEDACGGTSSIIATVKFLTALASTRLIQHFKQKYGRQVPDKDAITEIWNEVHFTLYPEEYYYHLWKEGETPQMIKYGL